MKIRQKSRCREDLSGLEWAAEVRLDLLNTAFTVRCTSRELADRIDHLMGAFVSRNPTAVPAKRRFGLVDSTALIEDADQDQIIPYRDCSRLGPPGSLGVAISRLVAALNRVAVGEYDGFAVHAGVVASGDRAVALPADSGDGKSTLTAGCLKAGMSYASDEALCVDPADGTVVPYPKPIALGADSLELLQIEPASLTVPLVGAEGLALASDLGASQSSKRMQLAHVVISKFGHGGLELEEVAASEAMVAMLRFSFNHYKHGEAAFHLAAALASDARAWRLAYSNPLEAGEAISHLP